MANNTFKISRKAWYPQEKDFGDFVCGPSRLNQNETDMKDHIVDILNNNCKVENPKFVLRLHRYKYTLTPGEDIEYRKQLALAVASHINPTTIFGCNQGPSKRTEWNWNKLVELRGGKPNISIDELTTGSHAHDALSYAMLNIKIMKNYSILIHPQREDGGGDYKVILRRYIVKSYDLKGASVQAETIVKPGETFSCQEQNPKQIEY